MVVGMTGLDSTQRYLRGGVRVCVLAGVLEGVVEGVSEGV